MTNDNVQTIRLRASQRESQAILALLGKKRGLRVERPARGRSVITLIGPHAQCRELLEDAERIAKCLEAVTYNALEKLLGVYGAEFPQEGRAALAALL